MPLYLALFPPASAPSLAVPNMPLREFAARMSPGCALPPLVYAAGAERYYLQTPLWPAILPDVDLCGPPFSSLMQPGDCFLMSGPRDMCFAHACRHSAAWAVGAGSAGLEERQVARMWLSPEGAVSPLHYDSHTSFLTQASVLFYFCIESFACDKAGRSEADVCLCIATLPGARQQAAAAVPAAGPTSAQPLPCLAHAAAALQDGPCRARPEALSSL
jgi:hypothetical protein